MKHDVFISYSRRDLEFVLRLEDSLNEAGITYWIDRKDIGFGTEFANAIAESIRATAENAKVFICVVSPNTSEWSYHEIKYAIDRGCQYILPIYLDCTENEIPGILRLYLSPYQGIHIKKNEDLGKVTDLVQSMLGRSAWVFLSHSNKDFDKIKHLRNKLEDRHFKPLLFFLKCLDDDDEIFELVKREISVRDRFLLCKSNNAMASKWVEKEVEFIKSLNRPYETIDIEASEEEIEKALERFDRRSTIYIWSTEFSFNQALARELMNKSFRVSLLPTDFFERPASYNPVSDGYLIMLISRELTPAETDAVERTAIRYCNYTYPVVIDEEGRKNWKLFRDIQNLDGLRTKEHLFKPDSERIAAIVRDFIELDNFMNKKS